MTQKMTEAQKRGKIEKRTQWVGFEEEGVVEAGSSGPASGGTNMVTIEVQRQVLPIFDSPNQGARFYNPDLPSSEPFVPGHRTCAGCGPSIHTA